jgi:hypothetical protein
VDPQVIQKIKETINQSNLTKTTKTQLLSLMDFVNYPEVKSKILEILDMEDKVTDIQIKYLKEMEQRFRNSDLFGYSNGSMSIPKNMRENLANNQNNPSAQTSIPQAPQVPVSPQPQPQQVNSEVTSDFTNTIPQTTV